MLDKIDTFGRDHGVGLDRFAKSYPCMVVSDNATELTSNAMLKWQEDRKAGWLEHMGGRIVLLAAGSVQLSAQHAGARNALEYAIRIIEEEAGAEHGEQAKDAIEETLRDEGLSTGCALSLLTALDAEAGCRQLLLKTEDLNSAESRQNAIDVFASVFGDRHFGRVPDLTEIPEDRRVPLVKDLVLRAYQAVRREEDIEHEGTYKPDLRDNAQDARSFLLEALLNSRLPETLAAIHELAEQPELGQMPDRLRQMADEIAAQIRDMTAHPVAAYQALDRDGAFIPFDHKSLFTAMMTKLDTFEHDFLHAEDSPVNALRLLDQETELRRFIAFWLRKADQGSLISHKKLSWSARTVQTFVCTHDPCRATQQLD